MVEFIQRQTHFVDKILLHIGNSSIAELLLKIISIEDLPEGQGMVMVSDI